MYRTSQVTQAEAPPLAPREAEMVKMDVRVS